MERCETGDSEEGQIARPKLLGRDGAVRYTQASRAKEALWEGNVVQEIQKQSRCSKYNALTPRAYLAKHRFVGQF